MDGEADSSTVTNEAEIQFKHCPTCGKTKSTSDFSRSRRSKDSFYWECKSCKRDRDRKDYVAHRDRRQLRAKRWKEENPDKVKEAREQYKDRRRELERQARTEARKKRIEELGLKPWTPHNTEQPEPQSK